VTAVGIWIYLCNFFCSHLLMAISLTGSAVKYCQQLSDSLGIPRDSCNLVSTYFNTSITVFICHSSVDSLWVDPLVMNVYQCGLILTTVLLCRRFEDFSVSEVGTSTSTSTLDINNNKSSLASRGNGNKPENNSQFTVISFHAL